MTDQDGLPAPTTKEFKIDITLLQRIAKRRWKSWSIAFLFMLVIALIFGLFFYPQTYTSVVSISMQQSTVSGSALSLLANVGGAKKYTGVLRSRQFVDAVDKQVNFTELLGMPDTKAGHEEALETVVKSLKIDDNALDGLLYITVTLNGPARFGSDPNGRRQKLHDRVAVAAHTYAEKLKEYLIRSDTDKELALLRAAEGLSLKAEKRYDDAIENLGDFLRKNRKPMLPSNSSSSGLSSGSSAGTGNSDISASGSQIQALYIKRGQLEAQIKAFDASHKVIADLLNQSADALTKMSDEDPLLTEERIKVEEASAELEALKITYGEAMPRVKRAQEKLQIAQQKLIEKVEAILHGKSSETAKRAAMQVEYDTVIRQIKEVENILLGSRMTSFELEKRRNNVMLAFETLKTTATQYATLQIQTVSAQNRMNVVDDARPPLYAKPGIILIVSVCASISLLLILLIFFIEYLIITLRREEKDEG